jgi:hypothetical protein
VGAAADTDHGAKSVSMLLPFNHTNAEAHSSKQRHIPRDMGRERSEEFALGSKAT